MSLCGIMLYGCALRALVLSEHISGAVILNLETFIVAEARVHLFVVFYSMSVKVKSDMMC